MDFAEIKRNLRKLTEESGRNAALLGTDRGLNPHHHQPDRDDWFDGYDSVGQPKERNYNILDYYEYDYLDLGVNS